MFDTRILSNEDYVLMDRLLSHKSYGIHADPDLIIAPDGNPYLYRWYIVRQEKHGNVYLHVQVASDPERPYHDHPWDNTSCILSGGYDELWSPQPWLVNPSSSTAHTVRRLRKGDTCFRRAGEAHRLLLPEGIPYTISMFSTGPEIRDWGFYYPDGWRPAHSVTKLDPATRRSIHTGVYNGTADQEV